MTSPSSAKTCVIPSFFPRIAAMALEADLDVDAGGQRVEALQRVDGFRRGLKDVDQALVRAHLEVLARVLVLEGRADHAIDVLLSGQRHGAGHAGAGALRGFDDLAGSPVDGVMVIRLEPDSNFLCCYRCHFYAFLSSSPRVLPRIKGRAPFGGAPPRSYVFAVVSLPSRQRRGGPAPTPGESPTR